jgi:hypothetical protein
MGNPILDSLSLGLYRSPSEWPWQYVFLVVLMIQFFAMPPGRSLGLDVFLAKREDGNNSFVSCLRWVR